MQYREYGKTGIRVSALGYGAMRLPFKDEETSVALLRRGMDLGINYIDSAFGYGDGLSEVMVGKAIAGRRDKVYVATKNPLWGGSSPDDYWRRLETSLKRLGTDYIDFYKVVHSLSWNEYNEKYQPELHKLALKAKDQGMIRHIVCSCHDSAENIIKICETGVFEGFLIQYNLLDRGNAEVIDRAHSLGMGVEIMGPVGGGRLGAASARLEGLIPGVATTPELALRFVLANPAVTVAFSGMEKMAEVEENCATAAREEPLSAAELTAVQAALEENKELWRLYCTGCEYCLPCPQGVAIPDIFAAMNYHRVWGLTALAKDRYKGFGPDNEGGKRSAIACIECGQCEEKCPQKIKIIEQLKESHAALAD